MKLSTTQHDHATVISCDGRFDAFEVDAFDAVVAPLLVAPNPRIELVLTDVEFIDSSALAVLVRTMKRARELGGDLVLMSPSDPVTVIFELTRLDAAFDIIAA